MWSIFFIFLCRKFYFAISETARKKKLDKENPPLFPPWGHALSVLMLGSRHFLYWSALVSTPAAEIGKTFLLLPFHKNFLQSILYESVLLHKKSYIARSGILDTYELQNANRRGFVKILSAFYKILIMLSKKGITF